MTQSPGSPSAEQRGSNWEHGADWRWQRVPRIQTQSLIPSLSGGHMASLRSGHGRGASRGKGWIPVPAVPGGSPEAMGERCRCPVPVCPGRSPALQWQGHQQAACPRFGWGSIQPVLGAPPGTGGILRAPAGICTPLEQHQLPVLLWEPEMPWWGPAAGWRQPNPKWFWWVRALCQTWCVTVLFFLIALIFMVPNKKADYFPFNGYVMFPHGQQCFLGTENGFWGKVLGVAGQEEFEQCRESSCQQSPLSIPAFLTWNSMHPHTPFLPWITQAMLCVQNSAACPDTWRVCLLHERNRLPEKQGEIIWRSVLGKQQLPVVTCIFTPSVHFHCLQIHNSFINNVVVWTTAFCSHVSWLFWIKQGSF